MQDEEKAKKKMFDNGKTGAIRIRVLFLGRKGRERKKNRKRAVSYLILKVEMTVETARKLTVFEH